jgi:hypothetical protein
MAKTPTKKGGAKKPAKNVTKPADAPVVNPKEAQAPQVEENPVSEAPTAPPVAPDITEKEAEVIAEEIIKDVAEIAVEAIEDIVDHPPVSERPRMPTIDDLEEKALDIWWTSRNKPADINHYELAYSGVNISKFGMLEAKVGKFRFKRVHVGANWEITVEEKK